MVPTEIYAATAISNQLYNPSYPDHPNRDAFPEGFVFECPYHPGGSISVTTHRGYLGALRATVHCSHNGCQFSAYDDGTVSSPSQCPTARAERARDGPGDLKPGTRIPFHSLVYRRKWTPHQADSTGRVVIPADTDPVMERCPGCPVLPIKSQNIHTPQSTAKKPVASSQNKATDTNESSLPSNTEDRGSSCFENNIKGGRTKSDKKVEEKQKEDSFEGFGGNRLWNTPPESIIAYFDRVAAENPGPKQMYIHPVPPPPRDKPPPRSDIHVVDAGQMKLSGDDDYVNVPRSPEKASLPRRWLTPRSVHYHDAAYNDHSIGPTSGSTTRSTTSSEHAQNGVNPEAHPGTAKKSIQLGDTKIKSDRGGKRDTLRGSNEAAAKDSVDDLSAESIANLVLRLAEIPERLNSLEKMNEAIVKNLDAKNAKIEDLEAAIERAKRREQDLEDIIYTYETVGLRQLFSSLT